MKYCFRSCSKISRYVWRVEAQPSICSSWTSGAVIYTDMFLNPQIKLSILNNLQEKSYKWYCYISKVYKKPVEAIDEIASDIEKYLLN